MTTKRAKRTAIPKNLDPRVPFDSVRFVDKTELSFPCLAGKQFDTTIYLGWMPLEALITGGFVDVVDPLALKQAGHQREGNKRRIARVASEFNSRRTPMVDPIYVNVKKRDIRVSKPGDSAGLVELEVTIDQYNRVLAIVDGQHRAGGLSFSKWPGSMPIPVVITVGMDDLRLRRLVSDIGGNMVKHDKAFLGSLAASLMLGQNNGKISGALNMDDPIEVRKYKAAATAEFIRSMTESPLYNRMTLRAKDADGRIPMARLIDLIDWTLSRSSKLDGVEDPMTIAFIVIDFFRAMRILIGDEFSKEGVMLSAKAMRVLSRIFWHVTEELFDEMPDGSFCYRGMQEGQFSDADTRYEQVTDLLGPLRLWREPDDTGASRWARCHSDKHSSVNTWYAWMLMTLGWQEKPSCVPNIRSQLTALRETQ